MLQLKGKLKDWVIEVDGANQFADLEQVRSFVIESRKFTRKVVLVSADKNLFEGFGWFVALCDVPSSQQICEFSERQSGQS